jgi:C_GCAxxG_C_C family probable redox protein
MNEVETAVALFADGHSCAQAVFEAYAPSLGLEAETAARIATGFSGGMHLGGMCGAASGAIIVLGLALSDEECTTRLGRASVLDAVGEFAGSFRERAGALDCPDILGCDLRTPEGMQEAVDEDRFGRVCPNAVRDAATILGEILAGRRA